MQKLISILFILAISLWANTSLSEETRYGLGIDVDDDLEIFAPIDFGNIVIEPSLLYSDNDSSSTSISSQFDSKFRTIQLGVGIFGIKILSDSTHMYYGGRMGYIDSESEGLIGTFGILPGLPSNTKSESDGYYISPTLGVQYFITQAFTVSLDVAIEYSEIDGTTRTESPITGVSITKTERTQHRTETKVILRYYF